MRGQSLPQMALAWILRHDVMTAVLTGTSRLEQLEENVASLEKLDFTADELRKIDAALGR